MPLPNLLRLQLLYCTLGILFNVASWWMLSKGAQALTPTAPLSGIAVMVIYGLFLLTGFWQQIPLYRILMALAVLLFGYSGVIVHILTLPQSPELYYSFTIGIIAILINLFGLVLNVIAVLGKFS